MARYSKTNMMTRLSRVRRRKLKIKPWNEIGVLPGSYHPLGSLLSLVSTEKFQDLALEVARAGGPQVPCNFCGFAVLAHTQLCSLPSEPGMGNSLSRKGKGLKRNSVNTMSDQETKETEEVKDQSPPSRPQSMLDVRARYVLRRRPVPNISARSTSPGAPRFSQTAGEIARGHVVCWTHLRNRRRTR